jgi:hypothetical protein
MSRLVEELRKKAYEDRYKFEVDGEGSLVRCQLLERAATEIERLTRLTGPGFVAVPVEPTPEMISAMHAGYWGEPVFKTYDTMQPASRELWRAMYRSMLAAAQQRGDEDGPV